MPILSNYTQRDDGLVIPTYTESKLLAANVPEFFNVPTDLSTGEYAKYVMFGKGAAADFYAQTFTATDGADRVTNGAFAADESWTKGTGWTIAAGVAASDGTQSADADLEQTGVLVEGQSYLVTFTVSGYSAGNVTAVVGGTEGTDRGSDATFTEVIVAGSSQVIALRADADFVGNVDNFSILPCASVPGDDATGLASQQNPIGFLLNGNKTVVSIVSAGTPIITASFYK